MAGGRTTLGGTRAGRGIHWNSYPMPAFPHGPTTMVKMDFWGLSAYSKYPEAAWEPWELFQFVTTTKEMQELNIRTYLVGPALVALWPFWEEFVRQIAPPLRDKHLHYYPEAEQYAHGHVCFKYERLQTNSLIAGATTKLPPAGAVGVTTVLRELTARINAGRRRAPPTPRRWPGGRSGIGRPPAPLAAGMPLRGLAKAVTLVGDGADGWTPSTNDSFAGSSSTARQGTCTCRVVALENVDCPHLSQSAKVGLGAD